MTEVNISDAQVVFLPTKTPFLLMASELRYILRPQIADSIIPEMD